jgi:predicted O-methyltransferase YrrM
MAGAADMTETEAYTLVSECNPAMCWSEVAQLALAIQDVDCDTVLEIGVHAGGSLLLWRRLFNPSLLIGVDNDRLALSAAKRCQAHILAPCLSQDVRTYADVVELLAGCSLDLLVIDGGHRLEEVRLDHDLYSRLVRPGGMIVFHDIYAPVSDVCQIRSFWDEIKTEYHYQEFYQPEAHGSTGLGLLWVA